jgi:hypothetical protein
MFWASAFIGTICFLVGMWLQRWLNEQDKYCLNFQSVTSSLIGMLYRRDLPEVSERVTFQRRIDAIDITYREESDTDVKTSTITVPLDDLYGVGDQPLKRSLVTLRRHIECRAESVDL